MSESLEGLWSDRPNAPRIPSWVYSAEKDYFAGVLIGAVSYGITTTLFFRCMSALLNSANRIGGGVKWGLIVHTLAMFLLLTIPTVINLSEVPILYVDEREFPGGTGLLPRPVERGTFGSIATRIVLVVMPTLRDWLADGLLLYRCYVIYSMNCWVMAFPSLMYLASVVMGIVFIYQNSQPETPVTVINIGISYYSISLSLTLVLTFMIITRLVLHIRIVRNAIGASDRASGLYTTVITLLVESYALYAIAFLIFIVPWALGNWAASIFSGLLGQVEVIAPYLIILRVSDSRALTSEAISGSGSVNSIRFRGQSTTDDHESLPGEDLSDSMETNGGIPSKPDVRAENIIGEIPP